MRGGWFETLVRRAQGASFLVLAVVVGAMAIHGGVAWWAALAAIGAWAALDIALSVVLAVSGARRDCCDTEDDRKP